MLLQHIRKIFTQLFTDNSDGYLKRSEGLVKCSQTICSIAFVALIEDVYDTWQERGSLAHRRTAHMELSDERLQRLLAHCVHSHPHTHRAVRDPGNSRIRNWRNVSNNRGEGEGGRDTIGSENVSNKREGEREMGTLVLRI